MFYARTLIAIMLSVFVSACERQVDTAGYIAPTQPGGFNSEEEAVFQEAEALKYAIDQIDQQSSLLESQRVLPQHHGENPESRRP